MASVLAKPKTVLMGDLVDSTQTLPDKTAQKRFQAIIDEANENLSDTFIAPLSITLGDEFQALSEGLEPAFQAIHSLRLTLLDAGFACRFVIGQLGPDAVLDRQQAWKSIGPGFKAARALLDKKDRLTDYSFSLIDEPVLGPCLQTMGAAMTDIESRWTDLQFRYVLDTLNNRFETKDLMSKHYDVSIRSVYTVLEAARYKLYADHRNSISLVLKHIDKKIFDE